MSQEGRGCLVADKGGSDKEGLERKWDFKF